MLETSLYLWNEPHLISAVLNAIFLIYCSVSFAGSMHPYSSQIWVCNCLLCVLHFACFGNKVMLFCTFLEELRRIGIQSSLSACCNSVVTLSGPGFLTFGEVPDVSFSFVRIGVSNCIFQFFLIQSREVIYFQELTHFINIIEFGVMECFIVYYRIFCILVVTYF